LKAITWKKQYALEVWVWLIFVAYLVDSRIVYDLPLAVAVVVAAIAIRLSAKHIRLLWARWLGRRAIARRPDLLRRARLQLRLDKLRYVTIERRTKWHRRKKYDVCTLFAPDDLSRSLFIMRSHSKLAGKQYDLTLFSKDYTLITSRGGECQTTTRSYVYLQDLSYVSYTRTVSVYDLSTSELTYEKEHHQLLDHFPEDAATEIEGALSTWTLVASV
jgi:hypothetical protein